MNKVLIKLYVPLIEEQYDVWIPINKSIYVVVNMLVRSIYELSRGYYKPSNRPVLYDKLTAQSYDINKNAKQNNIRNGSEVILI